MSRFSWCFSSPQDASKNKSEHEEKSQTFLSKDALNGRQKGNHILLWSEHERWGGDVEAFLLPVEAWGRQSETPFWKMTWRRFSSLLSIRNWNWVCSKVNYKKWMKPKIMLTDCFRRSAVFISSYRLHALPPPILRRGLGRKARERNDIFSKCASW